MAGKSILADLMSGESPLPGSWFADDCLLAVSSHGRESECGAREDLLSLLIRALTLSGRLHPHDLI